jgi:hypothetical protein
MSDLGYFALGLGLLAVYLAAMAAVLFGAAGTLAVPMFWAYLALFAILCVGASAAVYLQSPDLVRERVRPGEGEQDRVSVRALNLLMFVQLLLAGLDVGRLHCFLGSSPTKWLRSFAMEPTASASLLWRVGACRVRRSLAAHRSPTFAMSAARIGAAGSSRKTAASCPRPRFANTRIRSPARRRNGSRSARIGRCSPSLVYGPRGAAFEDRRARLWMGRTSCLAFSPQRRTR